MAAITTRLVPRRVVWRCDSLRLRVSSRRVGPREKKSYMPLRVLTTGATVTMPRVVPVPSEGPPPLLHLSVKMITATTIAAVDSHLASVDLIPRITTAPADIPIPASSTCPLAAPSPVSASPLPVGNVAPITNTVLAWRLR